MSERRVVALANVENCSEPRRLRRIVDRLKDWRVPHILVPTLESPEDCFDNMLGYVQPGDFVLGLGGDNTANRALRVGQTLYDVGVVTGAIGTGGACDTARSFNGKDNVRSLRAVLNTEQFAEAYPLRVTTDTGSETVMSSWSAGISAGSALGIIDDLREVRQRRAVGVAELAARAAIKYAGYRFDRYHLPTVSMELEDDDGVSRMDAVGLTDIFAANNDSIGAAWKLNWIPYLDPERFQIYSGNMKLLRSLGFTAQVLTTGMPGRRVRRAVLQFAAPAAPVQGDGDETMPVRTVTISKGSAVRVAHPRRVNFDLAA